MAINYSGSNESLVIHLDLPTLNNVPGATGAVWVDLDALPDPAVDTIATCIEISIGPPGGATSDNARFAMSINNPDATNVNARLRCSVRSLDGDTVSNIDSAAGTASPGKFHFAATCDYTTGQVKIYKNGVLITTGIGPNITLGNTSATNSKVGAIAAANDNVNEFIDGRLEDLRVWSRVLDANEILTIFSTEGIDGMVFGSRQRFEMQSGSDGMTVNTLSVQDSGPLRIDAARFNGTPTYRPSIAPTFRRRLP